MIRLNNAGAGLIVGTALSFAAAGCAGTTADFDQRAVAEGTSATADIYASDGDSVGTATATALAGGGVRVSVDAHDLPQGAHGAHVHMTGRCDPPDFKTAGGHWNPTGAEHGTENPNGPHAGDMPNLMIGTDGRGSLTVNLPAGSYAGFMDSDGSAIVIHSGPDDMQTDPSGDSGSRIACGVFAPAG